MPVFPDMALQRMFMQQDQSRQAMQQLQSQRSQQIMQRMQMEQQQRQFDERARMAALAQLNRAGRGIGRARGLGGSYGGMTPYQAAQLKMQMARLQQQGQMKPQDAWLQEILATADSPEERIEMLKDRLNIGLSPGEKARLAKMNISDAVMALLLISMKEKKGGLFGGDYEVNPDLLKGLVRRKGSTTADVTQRAILDQQNPQIGSSFGTGQPQPPPQLFGGPGFYGQGGEMGSSLSPGMVEAIHGDSALDATGDWEHQPSPKKKKKKSSK